MLGIVLNEQQTLRCVVDAPERVFSFDKDYFQSEEATTILKAIRELYEKRVEITPANLTAAAARLNSNITEETVETLFQVEYSPESWDHYFGVLRTVYAKNKIENKLLKDVLVNISSKGNDLNTNKVRELVTDIEENLNLIEGKESLLLTSDQMIDRYLAALHQRALGKFKYSFGDSHLDNYFTIGAAPGQMTTLFAATGIGKSVYALSLVNKMINKGMPVLYISLEMDTISTMDRLIAMRRRIPVRYFYPDGRFMTDENQYGIPDEAFKIVEEEGRKLSRNKRFFFVEESDLNLHDVENLIRETQKRSRSEYVVVIIDLLTMVRNFSGGDPKVYEEAINFEHRIAKRNNVHMFNVVQANRNADSANIHSIDSIGNLRPSLNTIKNSHAIAERSRNVLGAFRARFYAERLFPDDPALPAMDDIYEVIGLKQSQGPVGWSARYLFEGETFSLMPVFRQNEDPQESGEEEQNNEEN